MSYEQLKREKMYRGRAFEVERILLKLPDDQVHPYDLVNHADSITILPVDEQNNILFVSQYRIGSGNDLLELPAGVLEHGEDLEVCAARELREETGMKADTLDLLGHFFLAPGYSTEHMYVYLATGLSYEPLAHDADEFLELMVIPVQEVYEMASRGKFHDAKTLAALMLASSRLQKD